MSALQILQKPVSIFDGLYSLNDLHKANGGELNFIGVVRYIEDLSKLNSVTPQRHRGFFVPVVSVSQPEAIGSKAYQHPSQVQSVYTIYGWVTSQNKPYGEYAGRYLLRPRVNPSTLFNSVDLSQNLTGGQLHA